MSFLTQNISLSLKNAITHEIGHPSLLGHHYFAFPTSFCIVVHPQQVSTSFLVSLAFHWCFWCFELHVMVKKKKKMWAKLSLNCCSFLLSWKALGNGLRPKLYSERIRHATLPLFPSYLRLNICPPSVQWNAPMALAHDLERSDPWNKWVWVCLPFLSMWAAPWGLDWLPWIYLRPRDQSLFLGTRERKSGH